MEFKRTCIRGIETFTIVLSTLLVVVSCVFITFSYTWQKNEMLERYYDDLRKCNGTYQSYENWEGDEWRVLIRNICISLLSFVFSFAQIIVSATVISSWRRVNLLWILTQNGILIGLTCLATLTIAFGTYFFRMKPIPISSTFCALLYLEVIYLLPTRILIFYYLNRLKENIETIYAP